jgi:hypothetical protein
VSLTVLIECSPRRPADGVVVPLRLVFNSVARANFLGVQWHPAVVAVPAFESSLGFDGRQFGAAPSPQIGELIFALTTATRFAASLVWTNAAVTMKSAAWTATGGDPADGDFATIWTGQAEDIATGNGEARVRLLDNGQALRVAALAGKFGSTGDALLDGADALKDRSAETRVPRAWGKLLSIPGLIVDRANGIWLFAGNAATSVQAFYDGGAAFTLGVARADLAALQAHVPADGAVDYCLDAGGKFLARPWSTPTYPFTAAATFGSAKAADIASAIVTGRTAVTFTAGTVTAFNALQGADCGLYLDDETSVAGALDRLFSGLGGWWRLGSAGTISLGRWGWTPPALTVPSHRRHAPERLRVLAPTRRRSLGYARNDRVHSEAEIARILLAGDLAYADGTPVEALKPADAGATLNPAGDAIGRNDSFEIWVDNNTPLAWAKTDVGVLLKDTASGVARRGTVAAEMQGAVVLWGEPFPVTAGEPLWLAAGFATTANATTGPSVGSAGWRLGIQYGPAALGLTGGGGTFADDALFNNARAVSGGIATPAVKVSVPALVPSGAGTAPPVYGQLFVAFEAGLSSDARGNIDYFTASRAGPAADATAANTAADTAMVNGVAAATVIGDISTAQATADAALAAGTLAVPPKFITALGASAALDVVIPAGESRNFQTIVYYNLTSGTTTLTAPMEYRIGSGSWTGFGTANSATDSGPSTLDVQNTGSITNSGGTSLNYQVRAVLALTGSPTGTVNGDISFVGPF